MSSVLDASAVLALAFGEAGASRVRQAINEGAVISAVNVAEVVTRLIGQGMPPEDARQSMSHLGVDVVPLDAEAAIRAGQLRLHTRAVGLSLGDRCCLALAEQLGLPALTADRAWTRVQLGVTVEAIR